MRPGTRLPQRHDQLKGGVVDPNRPMAFVEDEDLLDDVLKLAAAAGCDLECVPDTAAARLRWRDP